MKFDSLKDKCEYYRSLTDYRITPNSYVIVMVDGHKFSNLIKNRFNKPFDNKFISMMNETAKYLCENIQGAKFAYTQSDEISLLITDFDTPMTDSFFSYRLCKMQSLIAAMATAKFNQLYAINNLAKTINEGSKTIDLNKQIPLCTFDCKVWTVPNANDAFTWFLYRQIDCIRNSKQQTVQTYISHKDISGLNTDEQVALLKERTGVDWHTFADDRKFGRLVKKTETEMEKDITRKDGTSEHIKFTRSVWTPVPATDFKVDDTMIKELIPKQ